MSCFIFAIKMHRILSVMSNPTMTEEDDGASSSSAVMTRWPGLTHRLGSSHITFCAQFYLSNIITCRMCRLASYMGICYGERIILHYMLIHSSYRRVRIRLVGPVSDKATQMFFKVADHDGVKNVFHVNSFHQLCLKIYSPVQ